MKKKIYNLLFIILLSFSIVGIVNADNATSIETSISIMADGGARLISGSIQGLVCNGNRINSTSEQAVYPSASGITMIISGGEYMLKTKGQTEGTDLTINCTYDYAPYYMTKEGNAGPGALTIKLHFNKVIADHDYSFSLNTISNKSKRITGTGTPFAYTGDDFEFKGCAVDDDSKSLITCTNSTTGSGVVIQLVDKLVIDSVKNANATVTYLKKSTNETATIRAHVEIRNSAIIIADIGGHTCNFGPGWKKLTDVAELAQDDEIPNKDNKWVYSYTGSAFSVPECTYGGNEALKYEFKGWFVHDRTKDGNVNLPSDVCVNRAMRGSINYDDIEQNDQYNRSIFTCFEKKDTITVSLDGSSGQLVDGSGYTQMEKFSKQYIKEVTNGTAALPSVKFTDSRHEFQCWIREGDTNTCYKQGQEAPAGSYSLQFSTKDVVVTEETVDMKKEMIVGSTDFLNPANYLESISACTSEDNSLVNASYNPDKKTCTVTASKVTKGVIVNVEGTTPEGKKLTVKTTIVVVDGKEGGEGEILTAYSGQLYRVTGFLTNGVETDKKCTNYAIKPLYTTAIEKQNLFSVIKAFKFQRNGQTITQPINDNIYTGEIECDGKTTKIAAVCLDPSRQEPSDPGDNTNYTLDHSTKADGSILDKLTIAIYNDTKYRGAINTVALGNKSDITKSHKEHMAAATLAYRLLTIYSSSGANDSNSALQDQYAAYSQMVANIKKSDWGSDWAKNSSKGNLDNANVVGKMFCGKNYTSCSQADLESPNALKMALKLIRTAYRVDDKKDKITVNAYVANENTDIRTNGNYVKTIQGKFTGIPTDVFTKHFMSVRPTCETCEKYHVNVEFKIGRDLQHLVNFDEKMNALSVKYGDFKSNPYPDYADKTLYNEDGSMWFEYTISGNVGQISNSTRDDVNDAVGARQTAAKFRIATSVGIDGEEYILNTGQANPKASANFQRMEIFHRIDGTSASTDGNPSVVCDEGHMANCGWNNNFDISAAPSVRIKYTAGENPGNKIIDYTTTDIGSFLPACDLSKDVYNYKAHCTDKDHCDTNIFNPVLFVGAGCCAQVLDNSAHVYKTYCSNRCTQSTYSPVCKTESKSREIEDDPNANKEVLKIHEASKSWVGGDENYACVINNDEDAATSTRIYRTKQKKDAAGNDYAVAEMKDNGVCTISCKEDWDFTLPSLKNLLGPNAVIAGQYFVLGRDTVNTFGKRTCVTSRIDIDEWHRNVCNVSQRMIAAFNSDNAGNIGDSAILDTDAGLLDNLSFGEEEVEGKCISWDPISGDCDDHLSCPKITSITTPTVEFSYYTYACESGVGTSSGSVSATISVEYGGVDSDGNCKGDLDTLKTTAKSEKKTELRSALVDAVKGAIPGEWYDSNHHWSDFIDERDKLLRDMKQCQYWAFSVRNNNKIKDDTNAVIKVDTEFNPMITYAYDEPEFMAQLAGHNTLVKEDVEYKFSYAYYKHDGEFDLGRYSGNLSNNKGSGLATYNIKTDGEKQTSALIDGNGLKLSSGDVGKQLYAKCSDGGSGTYTSKGDKTGEGAGETVSWDASSDCWDNTQDFIKDANYIKKSVSLLSNYESDKYIWYIDTVGGFRQLGENPQEAMNNSKSSNKDVNKWSVYAESSNLRNMVFPISETTPRNIYQYSFSFYNIGNYNDNSNVNLGRIMGTPKSVIGNNSRVCFYEVIEGVCYCCGDVLETELVTPNRQSTRDILSKNADGKKTSTDPDLSCYNTKCDSYLESYVMSDPITEAGIDANDQARYGVNISSVSLNSMDKDIDKVGANWSDDQHYILEGSVYSTDKGAQLLKSIVANGDDIYAVDDASSSNAQKAPEYSYLLAPQALGEIQKYTETNGYQEKASSTMLYQATAIMSTNKNDWSAKSGGEERPVIIHAANLFLNDTMYKYVTPAYKNLVLSRLKKNDYPVCYVVDYKEAEGFKFGSDGNVFNGNNQHVSDATKCRWIDYVSKVVKANDQTKDNSGKLADGDHYYRLAFK